MTKDEIEALVVTILKVGNAFDAAVLKAAAQLRTKSATTTTPCSGIAPWRPCETYRRGTIVTHRGTVYKAIADHGGWEPGDARGGVWIRK